MRLYPITHECQINHTIPELPPNCVIQLNPLKRNAQFGCPRKYVAQRRQRREAAAQSRSHWSSWRLADAADRPDDVPDTRKRLYGSVALDTRDEVDDEADAPLWLFPPVDEVRAE